METAAETLRAAQLAASGLDPDTADGRSQQRLLQQRLLGAEVRLAHGESALAQSRAQQLWTKLALEVGPDSSSVTNQF